MMSDTWSDAGLVPISTAEFKELSQVLLQKFGIHLTAKKVPLVRGRLSAVLRRRGLTSFTQYLRVVREDATGKALVELADRISTNHTYFFREKDHFEYLRTIVLPGLIREREIRIWCAGCATGEEAYTLAMVCREWCRQAGYSGAAKILATDISLEALESALEGVYGGDGVKPVPEALLRQYFSGGPSWRVSEELRSMVLFKRLNLMDGTFPFRNRFHVIFCRNVMIYFDAPTRASVSRRLTACLLPGAHLFIGHSETLGRAPEGLAYVRPAVYLRQP